MELSDAARAVRRERTGVEPWDKERPNVRGKGAGLTDFSGGAKPQVTGEFDPAERKRRPKGRA